MNRRYVTVFFSLILVSSVFYFFDLHNLLITYKQRDLKTPEMYAVYGCSTPAPRSHRGYDYAFYLPLTALAWERIGFSSIIIIVGTKAEWEQDPPLNTVLQFLSKRQAKVLFLDAPIESRSMLGQTARLFVSNMIETELLEDDYILTSDADLWPIRRAHYERRPGFNLVLVHSHCCGTFRFKNQTYRMLPMGNIGATASVWRNIINTNRTVARDTESILQYFEAEYGKQMARSQVVFASDQWYMDQKIVSVRFKQWQERNGDKVKTYEVSDKGFTRVDRIDWHPERLTDRDLKTKFDAHMPLNGYLPTVWRTILPLVQRLYGKNSSETRWSDTYILEFYRSFNKPKI